MENNRLFNFHRKENISNKLRDRSGGLLIIVVIMLAVAMILITSALTITVAARNRYYDSALTSQANLTAASVAKTIAEAAKLGDFTTDELKALVTATETTPAVVTRKTISGGITLIPGLEGTSDASGNSLTSYTDVTVEYTNIEETNFKITVNTYLDAGSSTDTAAETVSVYLEKNDPVYPAGFGAAVAINGSGQLPSITLLPAPATAKSNFVIITGDDMIPNFGLASYSGDVIITGNVQLANVVSIAGDLVLYGPNAALSGEQTGGIMPAVSSTSNFLDLRNSANGGTTFISPRVNWCAFTPARILVKNSDMNFANNSIEGFKPGNGLVYTVGTGKVTLGGVEQSSSTNFTVTASDGSMDSLITKYSDATGLVQASLNYTPPSSRAALMTQLGLSVDYAGLSGAALIDKLKADQGAISVGLGSNGTTNMTMPFTEPAYYIDISSSNQVKGPITFDCTNNSIDVFITGTGMMDFNSNDAGIRFIRPAGSGNIGRIIFMEDNAYFSIASSNGTLTGFPGISGAGMDADRYSKTAGLITDGSEPYVYVYGFNNDIEIKSNLYVEGYYGLFGDGKFTINGGHSPTFYSRFNVYQFDSTSGAGAPMPYVPAPGEGTNSSLTIINPYIISGYVTE